MNLEDIYFLAKQSTDFHTFASAVKSQLTGLPITQWISATVEIKIKNPTETQYERDCKRIESCV